MSFSADRLNDICDILSSRGYPLTNQKPRNIKSTKTGITTPRIIHINDTTADSLTPK